MHIFFLSSMCFLPLEKCLLYEKLDLFIFHFIGSERNIDKIIKVCILNNLNYLSSVDLLWEIQLLINVVINFITKTAILVLLLVNVWLVEYLMMILDASYAACSWHHNWLHTVILLLMSIIYDLVRE